jgi:hypothetical protein
MQIALAFALRDTASCGKALVQTLAQLILFQLAWYALLDSLLLIHALFLANVPFLLSGTKQHPPMLRPSLCMYLMAQSCTNGGHKSLKHKHTP